MKTSLALAGLVVLQLVFSLLVQLIVIRLIGPGHETDAYVAALVFPTLLLSVLGTPLQNVWLPRLTVADPIDQPKLASIAVGHGCLWFGAGIVAIALALPAVSKHLFPGMSDWQIGLVDTLVLLMLPGAFASGVVAMLASIARARGRFVLVEGVGFAATAVWLAATPVAIANSGIEAVAALYSIRYLVAGVTLWSVLKVGLPTWRTSAARSDAQRAVWPILAGAWLVKLSPLVDRYWTSQAVAGTMTLFTLATSGTGTVAAVIERAVCTPLVPHLSRAWADKDYARFRSIWRKAMVLAGAIVGAGVCGSLLFFGPIVELVETLLGVSTDEAGKLVQIGLLMAGTVIVGSSGTVVVAAFYAMDDTATPIRIGVVGFLVGLLLKSVGFVMFGVLGLAAGASAYYVMNLAIMAMVLEGRVNGIAAAADRES